MSISIVYANDEASKKENSPTHRSMKNVKYLGINLTKEVKDPYNETAKTLLKTIKAITKWKDVP